MALQRWGERDARFTRAFLRTHRGRPPFDPRPRLDFLALAAAAAATMVHLAFWIAAIRAIW